MIILAIETSCDETAAAVLEGKSGKLAVLADAVSSQTAVHARWGGVVPNLAAREHLKNTIPLVEYVLEKSGIGPEDIDAIATTKGPGLIPALLIGTGVSKTLAWIWEKPLLGINHIEGHIYSNFVGKSQISNLKSQIFPVLCLVVSGGHTQLVLVKSHFKYRIVGQTLDDAAGEAFDKAARILGLEYPGGPAIAKLAADYRGLNAEKRRKFPRKSASSRRKSAIVLPRPMINSKDFNFSFSGLKTAVLYLVKKIPPSQIPHLTSHICHEFQQAVIDILIAKTIRAARKYKPGIIMMAGGVSANKELRKRFRKAIRDNFPGVIYVQPDSKYSVDNAVMIGAAAYWRWIKMGPRQRKAALVNWKKIETDANLNLA